MSYQLQLWMGVTELTLSLNETRHRQREKAREMVRLSLTPSLSTEALLVAVESMIKQVTRGLKVKQIDVVVSDVYCRHLLLPRPQGLRSVRELQASLSARFHSSFGDDAEQARQWLVLTDSPAWGKFDLVSAMRQETVQQIVNLAHGAKLQLTCLQSFWMWCQRQKLSAAMRKSEDYWLLASADGVHTITLVQNGQCMGVRSARTLTTDKKLTSMLHREASLYERAGDIRQVLAFTQPGEWGTENANSDFECLTQTPVFLACERKDDHAN